MTNQGTGNTSNSNVRPSVAAKPAKKPALLHQHKQQLQQHQQVHEPWLFQSIHITHSPFGLTPLPSLPSPSTSSPTPNTLPTPLLASPAPFYLDVESLRTLLPVDSRRARPRSSEASGSHFQESFGSSPARAGRNNQRHHVPVRLEALSPTARGNGASVAGQPNGNNQQRNTRRRKNRVRSARPTSVHRKLALRIDAVKAQQNQSSETKPASLTTEKSIHKHKHKHHHPRAHGRGFAELDEDTLALARPTTAPPPLEDVDEARRQKTAIAAQLGLTLEEYEALDAAFGDKDESDGGSMTARYHEIFAQFDVDGSGAISPAELRDLLKAAGEDMDDTELAKVITLADTDGDGEINFDEFMGLMRARKRLLQVANTMGVAGTGPSTSTNSINSKHSFKTGSSNSMATSPSPMSSLASPLPPLKLAVAQSKKHLVQTQYSRNFSRPTPNCLRPGAQVDVTQLRRELAIAEFGIQELNVKVRDGVHWVQQHCPVNSLKAQIYCHRWGLEKVQQLLVRLQSQSLSRAYQKWKAFFMYERNKLKANLFLKCKGSQMLTAIMTKWTRKTMRRRLSTWKTECAIDARNEIHAAAVELQRVWRGKRARLEWFRGCQRRAAIMIQSLVRGHLGRCCVQRLRRRKREHESASVLQRCYRGYSGKRLAKALFTAQRETLAARRIQRAFRQFQKRRLLRAIQRTKREHDCAVQLQCCMRCFLARQERRRRALQRRRQRSSVVIQRHTRGLLARRQCFNMKRQLAAAIQIQTRYRAFRSRWQVLKMRNEKADRLRRENERVAATTIQTRWRTTSTRHRYLAHKQHLREAQQLLAFQRLTSAISIQRLFRGYCARRTAQRLRFEKLKWMNLTLLNRAALRIQACWRGFHGRLASQLRLQAKRAMLYEEHQAATRIQSIARGKLARGERRQREAQRTQLVVLQHKRAQCALHIQRIFRGKRARQQATTLKQAHHDQARAALDRLVLQTKTRAAIHIQCCARRYLARVKYRTRKREVERRTLERALCRQRELAAVVIQCAVRRAKARRLLLQRRCEFEKRISIMASEKAYDEIERLREEQEAELAKLRVQLQFQEIKATQESASLRQQLEAQREADEQRREQEAQELATLKLEALMQQNTLDARVNDRINKMRENQKIHEAEALREQLEKQQAIEQVVRTHENEELAKLKMTSLLQTTTIGSSAIEKALDTEATRLEKETAQLTHAAEAMQREQAKLTIQSVCLKHMSKRRIHKLQTQQAEALAHLRTNEERVRVKALQEKEMALAKLKAMMDDEARTREQEIKQLEAQMLERARLEKARIVARSQAARTIQASARGYLGRQHVKAIQLRIEKEREARTKALDEQLAAVEAKMAAAISGADGVADGSGGTEGEGEAEPAASLSGDPADWVEYWDENAQASYFYNIKTQEASWTRPMTASKPTETTTIAAAVDYEGDPYAGGYTPANAASGYACAEYADEYGFYDQYGKYHYYDNANAIANGMSYPTPVDAASMQAAMATGMMYPGYAAAAAAYAYQAAMAFGGNPMLFGTAYNPQLQSPMAISMATTGASANEAPAHTANLNDYADANATATDSAVPPDPWEKFFDQYTGAAYYYNSITGEKYWA